MMRSRTYFRIMGRYLVFLLIFLFGQTVRAQKSIADSTIQLFAISAQLGVQQSFADLGLRFGMGGVAGGGAMFKSKQNFTLELGYGFIFGQQVKEDTVLAPLFTEQGVLIGRDGNPADVFIGQRGFLLNLKAGKIFPVIGPNDNSGIHIALGAGILQHRIRLEDQFNSVPQIAGDYKKGYDRLTNGFMTSQSLGYQHFSNYRFFNFYIGTEWYQGFTQSRRTLNFDTGVSDTSKRLDIMGTIVMKWYFPVYKRQPKEFYFY